jgi:transcriptional regulator with XRE-family HTH domain
VSTLTVLNFGDNQRECFGNIWDSRIGDMKETIGSRIKKTREQMSISQDELGKLLIRRGLRSGQSHIGNIESGRGLPSVEALVALAQELCTSTDYLVCLTDNPLPAVSFEDAPLTDESVEFERVFRQLSDERRGELLKIGQVFLDEDRSKSSDSEEGSGVNAEFISKLIGIIEMSPHEDEATALINSAPGPLRGRLLAAHRRNRRNGNALGKNKAG